MTNKIKSLLVRLRSGVSAKAMRTEAADTIEALHAQLTETRDLAEHWAILAEQRRVELGECRKRTNSVGRYCMSEFDCIEKGIDFSAYERGVNDAIEAMLNAAPKGEV
jgi:hypothetical protein